MLCLSLNTYLWLKIFDNVVFHYSLALAIELVSLFFHNTSFREPPIQMSFQLFSLHSFLCTLIHTFRCHIKPTLHNNTEICLLAIYYCQFRLLLFINVLWTTVEFGNLFDLNCTRCALEVVLHDTAYAGMEPTRDEITQKKYGKSEKNMNLMVVLRLSCFPPSVCKIYNFFTMLSSFELHPFCIQITQFGYYFNVYVRHNGNIWIFSMYATHMNFSLYHSELSGFRGNESAMFFAFIVSVIV